MGNVDILKRNLSLLAILFFLLFVISLFSVSYFSVIFLHLFIFCISLWLLWQKDLKNTLSRIGLGSLRTNIYYSILGIALIFVSAILLNILLSHVGLNDENRIVQTVNKLPVYVLIFGILFAPFSEELCFRAYLSKRLAFFPHSGILLSSILFSLVHFVYGSIYEFAGTFFIGLILAAIYTKSRSIVPCIVIHILFNFLSISIIYSVR